MTIQNQSHEDLIYLLYCGIHLKKPDKKKVKRMDLKEIYLLSVKHSLDAIVCMALESVSDNDENFITNEWRERRDKSVRKNILLDIERGKLFSYMEEKGIWHVPLKGILIKDLYPKSSMRQMSDNDILFDPIFQQEICNWFIANGYNAVSVGEWNHDVYQKEPVLNFEMHTSLFGDMPAEKWKTYWNDMKTRLVQVEGKKYEYRFEIEEFYLYFIAHAYKHYCGSGTGIRTLLDCYVILEQIGKKMDRKYLSAQLNQINLTEFEKNLRVLAETVFANGKTFSQELTVEQNRMLEDLFGAGTYGSVKNGIKRQLHKIQLNDQGITSKTKFIYFKNRLFPDENYYHTDLRLEKIYASPFKKSVFLISRFCKKVIKERKRIWKELKMVYRI